MYRLIVKKMAQQKVMNPIDNLDELKKQYKQSYENKRFLLFDLANAHENAHTKVLLFLLKRSQLFLESFIERLGLPAIKGNAIISDQTKAKGLKGNGYIDLYIKYTDASEVQKHIIIENKIYGAVDTKQQIARYYYTILKENNKNTKDFDEWYNACINEGNIQKDDNIHVFYLTSDGTKEPNEGQDGNQQSLPSRLKENINFHPINYYDDILPWLEEDVLPNSPFEDRGIMIAGILQYIESLKQYIGSTNNSDIVREYVDNIKKDKNDVDLYKALLNDINSIAPKENSQKDDYILKSLRKELKAKAEAIFVNDVKDIDGDWRLHFTPSFICLYKQSWANLDTRKYSIPSIYLCGDQTDKFLKDDNPNWRIQIDHLGNNYKGFDEMSGLTLGPVARIDISKYVKCNKPNTQTKSTRMEYYKSIISDFDPLIKTIDKIIEEVAAELKENGQDYNLQKSLLKKLIERWPIESNEQKF